MSDQNTGPGVPGQPAGGTPGAPAAGTEQPWYNGIADTDLRGYVQTKGFKDPAAVAEADRNFEKLQGVPQDRLLKLPEKSDDPLWDSIYSKLGRPEKPDGYELKFEGDDAFAKSASEAMHKAGLTKAQAAGLNEFWNAHVDGMIKADTEARQQRDAAEMTGLRTKWGQNFDAHVEQGRRAGREFGLSEQEFEAISGALGSGKTLELFQKIGAKVGEAAPFNPNGSGGSSGFGMTKEAAQQRIKTLQGDREWGTRYLNGGAAEKEEMDRLQRIAAGSA
jgi:hypothetical protein